MGSKQPTMSQLALFVGCLLIAATAAAVNDPNPECDEYELQIEVDNVPRMDDESGTDIFFELRRDNQQKELIQASEPVRNYENTDLGPLHFNETVLIRGEEGSRRFVLSFLDADKGLFNSDDPIADFPFSPEKVIFSGNDVSRKVKSYHMCESVVKQGHRGSNKPPQRYFQMQSKTGGRRADNGEWFTVKVIVDCIQN